MVKNSREEMERTRTGEERERREGRGRESRGCQEGHDGLGGSQEKDQREELQDGPDLRQGERV